jgi:hypothetical protein
MGYAMWNSHHDILLQLHYEFQYLYNMYNSIECSWISCIRKKLNYSKPFKHKPMNSMDSSDAIQWTDFWLFVCINRSNRKCWIFSGEINSLFCWTINDVFSLEQFSHKNQSKQIFRVYFSIWIWVRSYIFFLKSIIERKDNKSFSSWDLVNRI